MELNDLMRQLVHEIGQAASVKAVFGEPVQQGETAVIPVAAVRLRGGGGGGFGQRPEEAPREHGQGGGAGMGLKVESRPVGYIRVTSGLASFEPIVDVSALWRQAALFAGLAGLLLLWGLRRRG